jgi:hypothetical protein
MPLGPVKRTAEGLLQRAAAIGGTAEQWARQVWDMGGAEGLRILMGLKGLLQKHTAEQIYDVCVSGAPRLRIIKQLLQSSGPAHRQQIMVCFAQSHPIIRELSTYAQFIEQNQNQNQTHTQNYDHEPPQHFREPSTQNVVWELSCVN